MNDLDSISLRSESVQEILSCPPQYLVRWGITWICAMIFLILAMSFIIKYPEFIPASVVITSENPPEKIQARVNSKIEKIFVKNNQTVQKGDALAVLQSSGDYGDILTLKKIIDSTTNTNISRFPISLTNTLKLGDLQSDYNSFAKAFTDEKLFTSLQPYAPENLAAEQSIAEYRSQIAVLRQQENLEQAKFALSKENLSRSQTLYNQGVISKMELENEKNY